MKVSASNRMYWPKIDTPKISTNEKLTGPIIIILGIIISLWANCTFVIGVVNDRFYDSRSVFLLIIAFKTHMIISIFSTSFLINGFKEKDPDLMKPWLGLKYLELLAFIGGIIGLSARYYNNFAGLIPVAVIFLLIGSYITLCIYMAWKKMKDNPNPPPSCLDSPQMDNLDKPPSYDSFTNQSV